MLLRRQLLAVVAKVLILRGFRKVARVCQSILQEGSMLEPYQGARRSADCHPVLTLASESQGRSMPTGATGCATSRSTIRPVRWLAGLIFALSITACGELVVDPLVPIMPEAAFRALFGDPCPSVHFSSCSRVTQGVRDTWTNLLSQGWMNDPPQICIELRNAFANALDFDEAWAGSSPWVEGAALQGGEWFVVADNSGNFVEGDLSLPTPAGLTVMLHESLHMAGYTHKSSQSGHPRYLTLADFHTSVASCHAEAIVPL